MPKPTRTAVLGGTFDTIHPGHAALLAAAFRAAPRVGIGLTTEAYLARHPKPYAGRIRSYTARRRALVRFLRRRFPGRSAYVVPLTDRIGGAADPGVDILVVSNDTEAGARAVNRERRRRGLPALRVLVVPVVRSDDLRPIAGRRIRRGELDLRGRRRTPIRIGLGCEESGRAALERSLFRLFGPIPLRFRRSHARGRSRGRIGIRVACEDARAVLGRGDYGVRLSVSSHGRRRGIVAVWDPEGPVGVARGTLRSDRGIDGLVRRVFRGRAPALR